MLRQETLPQEATLRYAQCKKCYIVLRAESCK
jgi:hypothetical protein